MESVYLIWDFQKVNMHVSQISYSIPSIATPGYIRLSSMITFSFIIVSLPAEQPQCRKHI